jgi:hypothetical protein
MLNWLEIYIYFLLPITIFFVALSVVRLKQNVNDTLGIYSVFIAFIVGVFGLMFCSAPVAEHNSYWGGKWTHENSKLISLSNDNSISGNLTRGTGSIQGDVSCSFALEWPDETVTVQSASTKDVVFHPNDEGIVKVLLWHSIEYYPRGVFTKEREKGHKYHIWIPRDNMNYYIKFN